jgi:aldose 1-epimerase
MRRSKEREMRRPGAGAGHDQGDEGMGGTVESDVFGTLPDGRTVERFTLRNARGTTVEMSSRGAAILSISTPDRRGGMADVVLGYRTLGEYLADRSWMGALIGRHANRIAGGRFTLDGRAYVLPRNDPPNHLHGGAGGFEGVLWRAEPFRGDGGVGLAFTHTSPAGAEGYPGTLDVRVTCTLTAGDALAFEYQAATDAPTPVNLTHHPYFNLAGEGSGDVLGHELMLNASRFTPVGRDHVPTGELRPVTGTPFDFTSPTPIGARIDGGDEQLRIAGGYDHNFVLDRRGDGLELAARLYEPASGRVVEIHTTEPGIQLYAGNAFDGGITGRSGRPYGPRAGVALETQHFPDSPNHPEFPSTILRPGETYRSRTEFRFSARP